MTKIKSDGNENCSSNLAFFKRDDWQNWSILKVSLSVECATSYFNLILTLQTYVFRNFFENQKYAVNDIITNNNILSHFEAL